MQYKEYGADRRETVLLLHGGGLSWWNYREAAERLQADYHVILPILDGHAGSDRPFTDIESNAAEILSFIDERLNGSVLLIGGLSLGAQIALEMLAQRGELCRCAVIESAAVLPSRLTGALVGPAVACSYGLIRSKRFARLQFRALHMDPGLFDDYYRDTCAIEKTDMIAFMKANASYTLKESLSRCSAAVHVFAGEREVREILRSARRICDGVPGSALHILPDMGHGDFSINHAEEYCETIQSILRP